MSNTLNLQLRSFNPLSSKQSQKLEFQRNFVRGAFLESTNNKKLAITKLQVPLSSVPLLTIPENSNDYKVNILSTILDPSLPATDVYKESSLQVPAGNYYSSDQVLDAVNKTILTCYNDLVTSSSSITLNGSGAYTNAAPSRTFNFAALPAQTRFLSRVGLNVSVNTTEKYSIYLENPAGVKKHVTTAWLRANVTYYFRDDFYGKPNDKVYNGVYRPGDNSEADGELYNPINGNPFYEPTDAFSGLCNTSPVGNWKVYIYVSHTPTPVYSITGNVSLTFVTPYYSGINYLSRVAPFVSLDKTTGYISWNVDERFLQNCDIYMGSGLTQIFQLEKYNEADDGYLKKIAFPLCHFTMTDPTSYDTYIQTFQQHVKKSYLLCQIEDIIVNSNSFNIINRDLLDGEVSTSSITSFSVDPDVAALNADYFSYFYQGSDFPFRSYILTPNQSIHQINITLQVRYRDGTIKDIYLLPGQSASLILSVFEDR